MPPVPLYLRTLWRYTNADIIIIIIIINDKVDDDDDDDDDGDDKHDQRLQINRNNVEKSISVNCVMNCVMCSEVGWRSK